MKLKWLFAGLRASTATPAALGGATVGQLFTPQSDAAIVAILMNPSHA